MISVMSDIHGFLSRCVLDCYIGGSVHGNHEDRGFEALCRPAEDVVCQLQMN